VFVLAANPKYSLYAIQFAFALCLILICDSACFMLSIRFMQDLEDMLGFRPCIVYFYLWKYVSPVCLIILISASVVEMAINPPGYNAWVQDLVSYIQWKYRSNFFLSPILFLCSYSDTYITVQRYSENSNIVKYYYNL